MSYSSTNERKRWHKIVLFSHELLCTTYKGINCPIQKLLVICISIVSEMSFRSKGDMFFVLSSRGL